MSLAKKLYLIQQSGIRVGKDGVNPHYKSTYVTLDNLLNVLLPIAVEHNLVINHSMVVS